jgi:hypothetical protein
MNNELQNITNSIKDQLVKSIDKSLRETDISDIIWNEYRSRLSLALKNIEKLQSSLDEMFRLVGIDGESFFILQDKNFDDQINKILDKLRSSQKKQKKTKQKYLLLTIADSDGHVNGYVLTSKDSSIIEPLMYDDIYIDIDADNLYISKMINSGHYNYNGGNYLNLEEFEKYLDHLAADKSVTLSEFSSLIEVIWPGDRGVGSVSWVEV